METRQAKFHRKFLHLFYITQIFCFNGRALLPDVPSVGGFARQGVVAGRGAPQAGEAGKGEGKGAGFCCQVPANPALPG